MLFRSPEMPKSPPPRIPRPTKTFEKAPTPRAENESDVFPVPQMSLTDPPDKAPEPNIPSFGAEDDLAIPEEPPAPNAGGDGFDLPELSRSIDLGTFNAETGEPSELPPKLELPKDLPRDQASGTSEKIDFSASVSGFSSSQNADENEFDLSVPQSDPPEASGIPLGQEAEIDFGSINLPSIDDEDSSDALPMALSSNIDAGSTPAPPDLEPPILEAPTPLSAPPPMGDTLPSPASLSPKDPSTFSEDAPILDAPPPIDAPVLTVDNTMPPPESVAPFDSSMSSLPPLGA